LVGRYLPLTHFVDVSSQDIYLYWLLAITFFLISNAKKKTKTKTKQKQTKKQQENKQKRNNLIQYLIIQLSM
jgi:uncharacterized membrane protein